MSVIPSLRYLHGFFIFLASLLKERFSADPSLPIPCNRQPALHPGDYHSSPALSAFSLQRSPLQHVLYALTCFLFLSPPMRVRLQIQDLRFVPCWSLIIYKRIIRFETLIMLQKPRRKQSHQHSNPISGWIKEHISLSTNVYCVV